MFDDERANLQPDSAVLVGAAQSVWDGSDARLVVEIRATDKLRVSMGEFGITPLERVYITDSDIRHIRKHHSSGERHRGQIDIVPDDFGHVPEILNDFDNCNHVDTDKLGNKKFELVKEINDVYYVVTIQRGKKKLQVKTMWKRPGASC
ncbi:MAG: hypothetical protein V8R08_00795 [Coriobacteriales bacterium]